MHRLQTHHGSQGSHEWPRRQSDGDYHLSGVWQWNGTCVLIRYVGGKTNHAKAITSILCAQSTNCTQYVEPFFGGGSMAKETVRLGMPRLASDIDGNLITLYQAIQQGWRPPTHITETQYRAAKAMDPCPLRTYIGFACSYGGKWFGGLARAKGREMVYESYLRIMREADSLKGIQFQHKSYADLTLGLGDLVYCDPPYAGTLGYGSHFSHVDFWQTVREWSVAGAKVFVSEYAAPADFTSVWAKQTSVAIHNVATSNHKIEHLWVYTG